MISNLVLNLSLKSDTYLQTQPGQNPLACKYNEYGISNSWGMYSHIAWYTDAIQICGLAV